jgi:hypothetical protein
VDVDEHVVGMDVGEQAVPVGAVPRLEVEFVHALQVARDRVVRHGQDSSAGSVGPENGIYQDISALTRALRFTDKQARRDST